MESANTRFALLAAEMNFDTERGPFGEDVTVDRDAAVIAFFAPIIEECRRTGHSTAEMR